MCPSCTKPYFSAKTPKAARVDTWTTLEIWPPPGPNARRDEISRSGNPSLRYFLVRCLRIHPVQSVVNNIRQLSGRGFLCICCIKLCLSQLYVFFLCSSMEAELWTHDMLRIVNLNCPECFVVKFRNVKVWVVDKLRKWNCLCFWKCWSVEGETCVVYETLFMLILLYVCNYAFRKFKYFEIVYLLSSVFVLFVWYTETLLVCFFTHILKEHYILCLITWAGNGVTEGRDGF